jgi:hypothetical protein
LGRGWEGLRAGIVGSDTCLRWETEWGAMLASSRFWKRE